MELLINGRFLSQRITGVQRFALEVVKAIDDSIMDEPIRSVFSGIHILVPRNAKQVPVLKNIDVKIIGHRLGHAWEQIDLPFATRGGLLLSLCQIGPLAISRQIVVMHDASVYGVPFAFSAPFRIWYKIVMPLLGRRAQKILTVSEFSRNELSRYCGIDASKLHVIPEGKEHVLNVTRDASVLAKHNLNGQRFVLAVSSMNPNKNFQSVVSAVEMLDGLDCKVVIAGGTDPRVFGSGKDLPDKVVHVGYVSDGELRSLYEAAMAFIYPSFYEGFGLPPLEAMALGCPVIVSKRASMPEVCGEAALYCDPNRPEDIAVCIRRLVEEPQFGEKMRRLGRAQAAPYTWRRSAHAILDIAEGLAVNAKKTAVNRRVIAEV